MRPTIRPGTYFVELPGGACFLTAHGIVRIPGQTAAQWLVRLLPYVTGEWTLSELTAGVPASGRELVEKLVTALVERGLVRDAGPREQAGSTPVAPDLAPYAPEREFLRNYQDRPMAAVRRYRDHATTVIGRDPLLSGLVRAGLCSGLRMVRAIATDDATSDRRGPASAAAWGARDPGQMVECARLGEFAEPPVTALVDQADLVVHIVDGHDDPHAPVVERCCSREGTPLVQVVVGDGEVWITKGVGWSNVRPRLRPLTAAAQPRLAASHLPSIAVTAVASQAMQSAFVRIAAAEPAQPAATVGRIDLTTLATTHHRVLPSPSHRRPAPTAEADVEHRLARLEGGARLTEQEFSRRAVQLVDDRFGLLGLVERDWAQTPLHVSEATVADPRARQAAKARVTEVGAGFTYQTARCRAALRALARYACSAVDQDRLVGTALGAWGRPLAGTRRVRLVPGPAAFPALAGSRCCDVAGVAAGYDWLEAVRRGLINHCRRLTVQEALSASDPFPHVDLPTADLRGEAQRCYRLLRELGTLPHVYDVTGALAVPTYAFCLDRATVAYASGVDAAAALANGLRRVLLAVQARAFRQPSYSPAPVPDLPPRLRGGRRSPPQASGTELDEAAAALRKAGHNAVAVPLDHDPALSDLFPYLVNVVLLDD